MLSRFFFFFCTYSLFSFYFIHISQPVHTNTKNQVLFSLLFVSMPSFVLTISNVPSLFTNSGYTFCGEMNSLVFFQFLLAFEFGTETLRNGDCCYQTTKFGISLSF